MPLNLLIIGPSGGGVTNQAKLISQKYQLTHISMGQLLRDEIDKQSEIGLRAKPFIDQGIWVPDEITFPVLQNAMLSVKFQNFILDGYPRAINQGPLLEDYLAQFDQDINLLIHLNVSFDEIMDRRSSTAANGIQFHQEKRSDDTPNTINQQQKSYLESINPILEYYSQKEKLLQVDGNRSKELIFQDINHFIDDLVIQNNK